MTRNEQLQEAARLAKKLDSLAKAEATAFAEAAERVKRRFSEKRAALLQDADPGVVELLGVE